MPAHDDHRDEAHVHSLRLALGSILSPKRPLPARSSTTSGTASPALHYPHSAIPLAASLSSSSSSSHGSPLSTPTGTPVPHAHPQPALPAVESSAVHGLDDAHPRAPDAVNARLPVAGGVSGSSTPGGGRTNFIGTLQSKSAWDALIHGSWV